MPRILEDLQVLNRPIISSRVAPDAQQRRRYSGPTVTERVRDALRVARPHVRIVGVHLPECVFAASKPGRALLTSTFERAFDALCDRAAVPIAALYAVGFAFLCHAHARRGLTVPDLRTAMQHEQRANADLDVTQWCTAPTHSLGDLHDMRARTEAQFIATQDLLFALDEEITRRTQQSVRLAA